MRKVLVITGSRGEWGYLRPILALMQNDSMLDFDILATNMQVLERYGSTYREIERDGFEVRYKIPMAYEGDTPMSHIKSLGSVLLSLGDILNSQRYDFILLAGDRGEQLMGAIAGAYAYIPTLHIQAGEVSGNIDGSVRHAIGKLVHLHSASNKDAENRLKSLGEQEFRVHNTGAPQIDDMLQDLPDIATTLQDLKIPESKGFLLVVMHPITEDVENLDEYMDELLIALAQEKGNKIVILPNNDYGSDVVRSKINNHNIPATFIFRNLGRSIYLTLLKNARCIVGNSSSGILEAPTYQTPCINIGGRQANRYQGSNVINCNFDNQEIIQAIRQATSEKFSELMKQGDQTPYGFGDSSRQIVDIIKNTRVDRSLLVKELTV